MFFLENSRKGTEAIVPIPAARNSVGIVSPA